MNQEEYKKRIVEEELDRNRKCEEKLAKKELVKEREEVKLVTTVLETPTFKIRVKEARNIAIGKPEVPNINLKEIRLPKPGIRSANVILIEPLQMKIKAPQVEEIKTNVRVSVHEPLIVQLSPLLEPQIKIKPLQDFSVRPLLEPERISLTKIKVSFPGDWPQPTLQLKLLSLISIEQPFPLKPKLKALPLEFLKEETPPKHGKKEELPPRIKITEAPTEIGVKELLPEFSSLPESLLDERYLDEDYRESGGLGGVSSEGLVCILVDKSRDFHEFIKLLCTKLWRIKSEGLPRTSVRSCNDELRWHELLEDVIELDKAQRIIEDLIHEDRSILNNAREEFINQVKARSVEGQLRFLLLPIDGKLFDKAYNLLNRPELQIERYLRHARFLAYKLKKVDEEFLGRLLISAFGFVETPLHSPSIGEYALELHGKFCRELEKIMKKVQSMVNPVNWPKPGENERWLHWALKHLTYMHLISNEKIDENSIKSEECVVSEKVADVVASDITIEIETMYGTGDPIGAKINPYTIRPYLEKGFSGELRLIVPNLHALLYANGLLRLRRSYREEGLNLEIYIADVTGMGSKLIYDEERKPGLVKLVDTLKFIKRMPL